MRYPVLFVHGTFFRDDFSHAYWGRIPDLYRSLGANVYFGNHQSAAAVSFCGKELAARIAEILEEEKERIYQKSISEHGQTASLDLSDLKVNIIAHSKGGLDARWAISREGMADHVASLTTICTPHRGIRFSDHLLKKVRRNISSGIATGYNKVMTRFGDTNPDFLSSIRDLSRSRCQRLNQMMPDIPGVYYQSYGTILKNPVREDFPLNISFFYAKKYDGATDGFVSPESAKWGERFTFVETDMPRGISHSDMVDSPAKDIPELDVLELYTRLFRDLEERGF